MAETGHPRYTPCRRDFGSTSSATGLKIRPSHRTPTPAPDEGEALDAYSNVVVRVAETLRPAVVNLRVARQSARRQRLRRPVHAGRLPADQPPRRAAKRHGARPPRATAREMAGRVVGNDPWTDLAVVQADGDQAALRRVRRLGQAARRPARRRHRQPARLRVHGDGRRRQRAWAGPCGASPAIWSIT